MAALVPVVQLVNQFARGGAESQFVARLRRHPEGFRPIVGCLHRGGDLLPEVTALGLPVEYFGLRGSLRQLNTAHQIFRLAALIEREGAPLVHANDFYSNLLAVPAARLAGAKVICSRFDLAHWYGRAHHFAEAAACRGADRVLTNAAAVREMLVEEEGVRPERIAVLHNGLDLPSFDAAAGTAPGGLRRPFADALLPCGEDGRSLRPCIVVPAALYPVKGHLELVEAIEIVRRAVPDVLVLCPGEGPMRETLEQQIAERGLRAHVLLPGLRGDVPALLARAHLGCLPSHSEGLPNAIIEAMAARLPVVATAVGGTAELVCTSGPEANGILVPPFRPAPLAAALIELLRDLPRARTLGEAGRRRVERDLTLPALGSRLGALYRSVLAPRSAAPDEETATAPPAAAPAADARSPAPRPGSPARGVPPPQSARPGPAAISPAQRR